MQEKICRKCGGAKHSPWGTANNGEFRWRCENCLATSTFVETNQLGNNSLRKAKRQALMLALMTPGVSIRQAAQLAGVAKMTATAFAKGLARPQCPCGQPATHRGWCSVRFKKSEARQKLLYAMTRPEPYRSRMLEVMRMHRDGMRQDGIDAGVCKCGCKGLLALGNKTGYRKGHNPIERKEKREIWQAKRLLRETKTWLKNHGA